MLIAYSAMDAVTMENHRYKGTRNRRLSVCDKSMKACLHKAINAKYFLTLTLGIHINSHEIELCIDQYQVAKWVSKLD
jgi:hypothetical protein